MAEKNKKEEKKSKEFCFVIMPFGGWFDINYQKVLIPAIKEANFVPIRADNLYRSGTIVNDIWNYTKSAKIIIAELTGKNPNVLYELGLAHAIAKPVILISQSIDDIPFDLRALRIIVYDKNDPEWGTILKTTITKSIIETLEAPLKSILPTFLDFNNSFQPIEATYQEKELLEIKQDLELIKRAVREKPIYSQSTLLSHRVANFIQYNLGKGVPHNEILDQLSQQGVDRDWAIEIIEEIYNRAKDDGVWSVFGWGIGDE